MSSHYNDHIATLNVNASKITTTAAACVAAACITFPAEMYRLSFTAKALSTWDFESISKLHNNVNIGSFIDSSKSISQQQYQQQKQKLRLVVSPLFRLVSHEVTLTTTMSVCSSTATPLKEKGIYIYEMIAGATAGTCQAILLCPLEAHRANQLVEVEHQQQRQFWKHWIRWTHSQIFQGGTSDPLERKQRAYHGVGVLAAREIIFNVSFFPLFNGFRRYLNANFNDDDEDDKITRQKLASFNRFESSQFRNTFVSGIFAGVVCSLAVTPMDVAKNYYMYSREQWSIWSGKRVFAPPLQLLFRGLTLQAFVFGPTFGLVAAIYELA